MNGYIERIIKEEKNLQGGTTYYKELFSSDDKIKIEKKVYFGRDITMTYYLPVCNDDRFYYDFVRVFNEISKINKGNTTPSVYEDADELDNSNHSISFNVPIGDVLKVSTLGFQKQIIVFVNGRGIVNCEKDYDYLVTMTFEETLKKSLNKGKGSK